MTYRILHITASLARSGTAGQLALLAARLPRDEFAVHVCALNSAGPVADELRRSDIKVHWIGRRWKLDPLALWRLRRLIAELRPNLVHTWLYDANCYGRPAARAAGVRHVIAAERHIDTWKTDQELAIDRLLARWTDRLVTGSPAVRDFYAARGIPPDKITVIPSGVLPPLLCSTGRAELLAELNVAPDSRLIAYVGSLVKQKRLKELIWATDQLKALGLSAHLVIVGSGPLRQALDRYARLNRIRDRVHFLGVRDDVPRLLSQVDVLWQAGVCEGQSMAILEAMAAGVPVVAVDAPGNRELVVHGETGYLTPPTEKAGFARCTLPLLENPELADRFGSAARHRVLNYFGADGMAQAYARMYRELLD